MARFSQDLVLNKPDDFVMFIMDDYLKKSGFQMSTWKNESAYKTGDGFIEAVRYLKWNYQNGVFHLEAWIKGGIGKEMDLEGIVAIIYKKPFKKSLEMLFEVLQQPLPERTGGTGRYENAMQTIQVATVDNSKSAVAGFILSLISLPICIFYSAWIGIIMGCVGYSMSRMGSGSSKGGLATAGKVLGILSVVFGICGYIINFILIFTAFM